MNFQTSVKTCLTQKYATFAGRASRSEYWWFVLAYLIGALIVSLLGWLIYLIYMLALIVPATAAGWRRLQDTGRPGWYILIPVGVGLLTSLLAPGPTADPMAPGGMGSMGLLAILGVVQLILAVIYIYWLTRPSEPETNAYGPPPQA
ncbi:hypothetical protein A3731_26000 [Roseovarius sp. HI0049]|nr:hypothetical protein A3731_26000 [Roseovarius sp. HI0049]